MDSSTGERIREARAESYVCVHNIKRAGHHVHAEQPDEFNRVVNHICSTVDCDGDSGPVAVEQRSGRYQEEAG